MLVKPNCVPAYCPGKTLRLIAYKARYITEVISGYNANLKFFTNPLGPFRYNSRRKYTGVKVTKDS